MFINLSETWLILLTLSTSGIARRANGVAALAAEFKGKQNEYFKWKPQFFAFN